MNRPNLINAMQTNDATTTNGMATHSTSNDSLIDMFFTIGAMRNQPDSEMIEKFSHAFDENKELAVKMLFWARDIRGGQGERKIFRTVLNWLASNYPEFLIKVLHNIPEYGRWDDLFKLVGNSVELDKAITKITIKGLGDKQTCQLCAKWLPREKSANKKIAINLARLFGVSRREYRKVCSGNSVTIETLMSSNKWKDIEFAKVPSVAIKKYRKALSAHLEEEFKTFLENVKAGTETVHASTLYPYDVIRPTFNGWGGNFSTKHMTQIEKDLLTAQWDALPDYFQGHEKTDILPIIDTSGSMFGTSGDNVPPIVVSISLGLYLAERNQGKFKNYFMTFTDVPDIVKITGKTLEDKCQSLRKGRVGYNTNLEAVFTKLLDTAVQNELSESDMPRMLLLVSDMEFDGCVVPPSDSAMAMVRRMYKEAGFEVPTLVFWRVNTVTSKGNIPVKFRENNVALVSGASPSNLKYILSADKLNPMSIMMKVLDDERYAPVSLA